MGNEEADWNLLLKDMISRCHGIPKCSPLVSHTGQDMGNNLWCLTFLHGKKKKKNAAHMSVRNGDEGGGRRGVYAGRRETCQNLVSWLPRRLLLAYHSQSVCMSVCVYLSVKD